MKRQLTVLSLTLAMICMLAGCSSSSSSYDNNYTGGAVDTVDSPVMSMDSTAGLSSYEGISYNKSQSASTEDYTYEEVENEPSVPDVETDAEMSFLEEKLVYKCDLTIETLKYDETYNKVKDIISQFDGIIQYENSTDRDYSWYRTDNIKEQGTITTNISCRVPSSKYNEFVETLSAKSEDTKITSKSQSVENISQEYYDNTAMVEALKIQEQKLLDIMQNGTVSEMIEVESRLSEVQYQINRLTTDLIYMDMDVDYSYVNIEIEEVKEYTTYKDETTFFSRLGETFKDVLEFTGELFESVITFILYLIPVTLLVLLPLGLIAFAIIKFIIKKNKKYEEKRQVEIAARQAEMMKRMAEGTQQETQKDDKKSVD